MRIKMRLNQEPFKKIKAGIKDVEYRLNDEKRQQIKIGDIISFQSEIEERETIEVVVTELRTYENMLEMYSDTFNKYLKDYYSTPEDAVADTTYYSDEDIGKYGCLTIFFKIL